jgi:hypothetical protein
LAALALGAGLVILPLLMHWVQAFIFFTVPFVDW